MDNEEKILQLLRELRADVNIMRADMDAKMDTLRADMNAGFSALDAKLDKNFADVANSQARVLEVVGESFVDLTREVQELKDVTTQLAFDHMLVKKRIAL